MSWIKNLAVIIGITITPLLILDAYFLYDKLNYRINKTRCDRALTNYRADPGSDRGVVPLSTPQSTAR